MSRPTNEVYRRYKSKTYKAYSISLRYDTDQTLIDYLEKHKGSVGITQIIREALEMYVEAENGKI